MKTELVAYLQMAIGLAGIVVTLMATPSFLDGMYRIRAGEGLPDQFGGIAGGVRVFCIVFVMLVFAFLVVLGLSLALADVAIGLGAARPVLAAALMVAALGVTAATVTLAVYRLNAALPAALATVTLGGMSLLAALDPSPVLFWSALTTGALAMVGAGIFARHGL